MPFANRAWRVLILTRRRLSKRSYILKRVIGKSTTSLNWLFSDSSSCDLLIWPAWYMHISYKSDIWATKRAKICVVLKTRASMTVPSFSLLRLFKKYSSPCNRLVILRNFVRIEFRAFGERWSTCTGFLILNVFAWLFPLFNTRSNVGVSSPSSS